MGKINSADWQNLAAMNVLWVLAVHPLGLCVLKLWSKGHQRIKMNDHCKPQSQCFCHHSFDELIIPFPAMLMSSYFKLSEQIVRTMLECSRLKNSSVPKFLWIILSSSLCWHSISSILSWQDVFKLRWRI
jgi:hypothetical protein